MRPVQVFVEQSGELLAAGQLYAHRRGRTESATFAYDPAYIGDLRAYSLDPQLQLNTGSFQTGVQQMIFGCFSDCAPDRWGRTLLKRQEIAQARHDSRTARTLGEIDFLLGVRDDLRQGALRLRIDEGPFLAPDATGVPAFMELPDLLSLAARVEADDADLPDLQRLVRVAGSLGGARPKAHIRTPGGRLAIAKFPSDKVDTWNVMAWEQVALTLAQAAGIDVPASQLHDIAGRHVLILERFDRDERGHRLGYASAMTMLEASDGDSHSYLDIAEIVEQCSLQTSEELHQLWRRMVFSILISNTDDHLRNHGFVHVRGDAWRLSPAFDMNPNPDPGPQFHSTSIDGSDEPATIEAALAVAGYFRLSAGDATEQLREIASAVGLWRACASRMGLSYREQEAMAPAFSRLIDV
ncbi:MAG TPA: type II toxin-antitoxin system HipA family toxin [Actinobacteria bacterium]|nr:type II toxin-antitoxin system HipA family toxin [Actinomycetota bacterium]